MSYVSAFIEAVSKFSNDIVKKHLTPNISIHADASVLAVMADICI